MAEGSHTMYPGANAMLNDSYGTDSLFTGYRLPAGSFGFPSNPQTANQIKAVSDKISTGTRTVEVSGVSLGGGGPLDLIDNIPKQHFKEINRMRELAGVDLTFHGPLVEATGYAGGAWDESQRQQAERQIISSIQRGHELDPKGNIVITFHASNGLPEPETKVKYTEMTDKGPKVVEKTTALAVVNERTGQIQALGKLAPNYFVDPKNPEVNAQAALVRVNEEGWSDQISQATLGVQRAQGFLRDAREGSEKVEKIMDDKNTSFAELFALSQKNPEKYQKLLADYEKADSSLKSYAQNAISNMSYTQSFVNSSYNQLQNLYNLAYQTAQRQKQRNVIDKLEAYQKQISPMIDEFEKSKDDPAKLSQYTDQILRGVQLLQSISTEVKPSQYRPLKEFAIEKAAQTFGNAAFESYKEFGKTAPIISIENPPAGSGINRAEEMEALVKEAQANFIQRAMSEKKMSEKEARKEAEKLIGVTWDVGHINMIRKYGYDKTDLLKQTEKIAPYVKHIHLSDNFGMEHTELPMGMGNVPIKEQEEILRKQFGAKFKEIKQIVETGAWFRNFNNVTPFAQTLEAFDSPIYGAKMPPYWSNRGMMGNYFSGFGQMLPDQHFQTYGSGFSSQSLPLELGGQSPGNRSRFSGTPNE